MKPVRIGLLGSGFVADFYMQGLANVKDQEVVFNYSRSLERARLFARHILREVDRVCGDTMPCPAQDGQATE